MCPENLSVVPIIETFINERRDDHFDSNNCSARKKLVNAILVLKIITRLFGLLTFWSRMGDCSLIIDLLGEFPFFQQIFDWRLKQLLQLIVQFYLKWRKKRTIYRKIANFL